MLWIWSCSPWPVGLGRTVSERPHGTQASRHPALPSAGAVSQAGGGPTSESPSTGLPFRPNRPQCAEGWRRPETTRGIQEKVGMLRDVVLTPEA